MKMFDSHPVLHHFPCFLASISAAELKILHVNFGCCKVFVLEIFFLDFIF